MLDGEPQLARVLKILSEEGKCTANGKLIGPIAPALDYGFTQCGFSVRKDVPEEVIHAVDCWMNGLMTCSPEECGDKSLGVNHRNFVAERSVCGWTQTVPAHWFDKCGDCWGGFRHRVFPGCHWRSSFLFLQKEISEKEGKKKICTAAGQECANHMIPKNVPLEKLSQLFQHISNEKDIARTDDFMSWMTNDNSRFLSDADCNFLLASMDKKRFDCKREFAKSWMTCQNLSAASTHAELQTD